MTAEGILYQLSFIAPCYIEEAAPGQGTGKLPKRRLLALILAAALALLLISCGVVALSEETIREWFLKYEIAQYPLRVDAEEIEFIDVTGDYALVFYSGMGPNLRLYRYETESEIVNVTAFAEGVYAISGGISINHVEADGQHIYFGTVNSSHWNPANDTVLKYAPQCLCVTDGDGNTVELDVTGGGYLCVLDAPLADFQLLGQDGAVCLDHFTYFSQGYTIEERQWEESSQ
ncbi:MAG: hypothetical protein IJ001_08045 [Oscillospiraceae bacterium]|nr:hypothetical protein [Oscillospiraceae bacterium]